MGKERKYPDAVPKKNEALPKENIRKIAEEVLDSFGWENFSSRKEGKFRNPGEPLKEGIQSFFDSVHNLNLRAETIDWLVNQAGIAAKKNKLSKLSEEEIREAVSLKLEEKAIKHAEDYVEEKKKASSLDQGEGSEKDGTKKKFVGKIVEENFKFFTETEEQMRSLLSKNPYFQVDVPDREDQKKQIIKDYLGKKRRIVGEIVRQIFEKMEKEYIPFDESGKKQVSGEIFDKLREKFQAYTRFYIKGMERQKEKLIKAMMSPDGSGEVPDNNLDDSKKEEKKNGGESATPQIPEDSESRDIEISENDKKKMLELIAIALKSSISIRTEKVPSLGKVQVNRFQQLAKINYPHHTKLSPEDLQEIYSKFKGDLENIKKELGDLVLDELKQGKELLRIDKNNQFKNYPNSEVYSFLHDKIKDIIVKYCDEHLQKKEFEAKNKPEQSGDKSSYPEQQEKTFSLEQEKVIGLVRDKLWEYEQMVKGLYEEQGKEKELTDELLMELREERARHFFEMAAERGYFDSSKEKEIVIIEFLRRKI